MPSGEPGYKLFAPAANRTAECPVLVPPALSTLPESCHDSAGSSHREDPQMIGYVTLGTNDLDGNKLNVFHMEVQ